MSDAEQKGQIEHGAYELLKARLGEQAKLLRSKVEALNTKRSELFGGQEIAVVGNERIRTENACIPRDIVAVEGRLLFGYNVQMGMKTREVRDVFSLHRFEQTEEGGFDFPPLPRDAEGDFLSDPEFVRVFDDLAKYYKDLTLRQLRLKPSRLLAAFQTGAAATDQKVLQWAIDRQGKIKFLDDKGDAEFQYPPTHDFQWTETTRADHVAGTHPHVSICNKVFVECVGGDLTVKVEDNTEDGLGIYREEVSHQKQALHDAKILYYDADELILLKILPYREETWRYLVYNTRDKTVHRIDAIGQSCVQLPEGHGLVFPGGYYLLEGTLKVFEGEEYKGLVYERHLRSPNGEDVLYVFRHPAHGTMALLSYNMVQREVSKPIVCHGYSLFEDGKMVVFRAQPDEEAGRVHPMQIWQTPYTSDEVYALKPRTGAYLEKVGNAELVRGISDAFSIARRITEQQPSVVTYTDLINQVNKTCDQHHWLSHAEVDNIQEVLVEIRRTAELVLQEFDKVQTLKKQATKAVTDATENLRSLVRSLRVEDWDTLDAYVKALDSLRTQRGHVITLKEMRYADLPKLEELEKLAVEQFNEVSGKTVEFLLGETAFAPYLQEIDQVADQVEAVEKAHECAPLSRRLDEIGKGLELLSDVVGSLRVDDATMRTRILERISEVLSQLNRARALVQSQRKKLGEGESVAEFGVQFKLFSQNVQSSLNMADTPEKCDETLSALMLQLEELEAKFGEYDQFVTDLVAKREEVYNSFSSKKQVLVEQRQRRVQQVISAGERILEGIVRRAASLGDNDKLNSYFASDPMVMKVRDLSERLRELGDPVKADELLSKLKVSRQEATRGLRDRQELFEEGANIVKLGRHKFSVNTEPVELTMVPREGDMFLHITGTDYFEKLDDPEFETTRPFWDQEIISETPKVYRGEYLAYCILDDAEREAREGLSLTKLYDALRSTPALEEGAKKPDAHPALLELVRKYAADRYDEGYDRGVHDVDATIILESILHIFRATGLLRYSPTARALALLFWSYGVTDPEERDDWLHQARSLLLLQQTFGPNPASDRVAAELSEEFARFCEGQKLSVTPELVRQAGTYLFRELGTPSTRVVTSGDAIKVKEGFLRHLQTAGTYATFQGHLEGLKGRVDRQYRLAVTWIQAFVEQIKTASDGGKNKERARAVQEEAAVLLLTEGLVDREVSSTVINTTARNLLGQHPRIHDRTLEIRLDEFLARLEAFRSDRVPGYQGYLRVRHEVLGRHRYRLRLDEYTPRVMSAFVRNKLINEVYLPLVGDNLAKQMGSVGEGKRTDLMGMLLLISPPGYGKTTLMEYVASRLGLIFVKVNGPSLGHAVGSLDPNEAGNVTAAQEVDKINFALEMGNNVMLYLDDIQHTNPELLQKFISMCDAQRRMEGVWKGRTRTYDLKGKRFCVVMAGNPYTESGARFQIPDMLANRADTYNLGDVLSGKEDLFELSYLENSLTSNPILAPLAGRDPEDLYKLIDMAEGAPIPTSELSHSYSSVEVDELLSVLRKLLEVQKVLLMVNREYIRSASMDDAYRTEPAFKLQGSYRNMNKLAEKVVPVMNEDELQRTIDDHYISESQTLTTGAEQNLLKLAELRGRQTPAQKERWEDIKKSFSRRQMAGGAEDDPVVKVTNLLGVLSERLDDINHSIEAAAQRNGDGQTAAPQIDLAPYLGSLNQAITALAERPVQLSGPLQVEGPVAAAPVPAPAPAAAAPSAAPDEALAAKLDSLVQIVPLLRSVAETIRGPKSKTIVMDQRLVKVFDELRDADDLSDVLEALGHMRSKKGAKT